MLTSNSMQQEMCKATLATTLFSMSVFGALRQNWMRPTFAFSMRVGPPAAFLAPCAKTIPSTSSVSSTVPPTCLTILIVSRSTVVALAASITFSTASTARGASVSEFWEITFELRQVVTASTSRSRCSSVIGCAQIFKMCSHSSAANMKASAIDVGCNPLTSNW